jgi:hypothetical protein
VVSLHGEYVRPFCMTGMLFLCGLVSVCSQYAKNHQCKANHPIEAAWFSSSSISFQNITIDLDDELFTNVTHGGSGNNGTCVRKHCRGHMRHGRGHGPDTGNFTNTDDWDNTTSTDYNATSYYTSSVTGSSSSSSSKRARQCFAGSETVQLENGNIIAISDVRVGDVVLAADIYGNSKFSTVIAVPHDKNYDRTVFTRIVVESGNDIKMTADHLVMVDRACDAAHQELLAAQDVQPGMCLLSAVPLGLARSKVVSVTPNVVGYGIYTIVAEEELVVVNGFIASPFASSHSIPNAYYNVVRALSKFPLVTGYLMNWTLMKQANLLFGELTEVFSYSG